MTSYQNALDFVKDQMQRGLMTADEANVKIVQMCGFRVVVNKLPSQVRKALNEAVKIGELGRLKKDGLKPEIYYHKNGRANAITEQNRIALEQAEKLKNIFA